VDTINIIVLNAFVCKIALNLLKIGFWNYIFCDYKRRITQKVPAAPVHYQTVLAPATNVLRFACCI